MKRILLNATQTEEIRVATVDGSYLYDLDIESVAQNKRKSNIYKGTVTRVEPSLEAAFVDYGAERHGFLPLKEIAHHLFTEGGGKRSIQKALKEGQQLIVQVEKEERGNKGAALTTQVSLAGRYLVLMPCTAGSGGISRKVESRDRDELRAIMNEVTVPEQMSAIARTMALGRTQEELQWDLDYLLDLWNAITRAADERDAPFLIYQESNIVSRTIRDHMRSDISELIIDSADVYAEAVEFMQQLMPQNLNKLKHYEDSIPLFTRYQIEHQIETAHQRTVNLRSGGSIVIDLTEALTSIDINSARATQSSDIEETAFRTNMEAAAEIARQLRLRDLGGLLVIDFIDMNSNRNQREVENCLRDATKADRARIQIGKISRFGLLEMSRQRLGASLREISAITCPRCDGQGTIRTVESLSLHILRLIEEEANKERTARISVQVPVPVATFLFNEKRDVLTDLDNRLGMQVVILANPALETPHYDIQRTRVQDLNKRLQDTASFDLPMIEAEEQFEPGQTSRAESAAVKPVSRATPPPTQNQKSLLGKVFGWLGNDNGKASEPTTAKTRTVKKQKDRPDQNPKPGESHAGGDKRSKPRRSNRSDSGSQERSSQDNKKPARSSKGDSGKSRRGGKEKSQQDQGQRQTDKNQDRGRPEDDRSRSNRRSGKSSPKSPNEHGSSREKEAQQATRKTATTTTDEKPVSSASATSKPKTGEQKPGTEKAVSSTEDSTSQTAPVQTSKQTQAPVDQADPSPGSSQIQGKVRPAADSSVSNPSEEQNTTSADGDNASQKQSQKSDDGSSTASAPSRPQRGETVEKPQPSAPASTGSAISTPESTSPAVEIQRPETDTPRRENITGGPQSEPPIGEPLTREPATQQSDVSTATSGIPTETKPTRPMPQKPRSVPGQIETRAGVNTAAEPVTTEKPKPAPRPTQWAPQVEDSGPVKQVETRRD